jgi:Na+/proline symporter
VTISPVDLGVIAVYMLAVLGLGLYQALKIRSSGDYYAGGRKFNKFYLMMHALGTASHADEPVSVIGGAYEKGLGGIWYTYIYLPLTPVFWLLAPFIRRTRFLTTADFFHARYDASLALLYAVMGVLKMSVSIGLVLKSTAVVFDSVTGSPPGSNVEFYAILFMTVVFVIYGFAGGLRATIVTESIQGPLIVLMSLLLVPFGLYKLGGFKGLHEALPESMFSLTATGNEFTPRWIIATSLIALIGWVAQPGIVAAVGSGKTELEGRVGYTYGTMIKRVCAMGWVFTGLIVAAMAAKGLLAPEQVRALESETKGREQAFGVGIRAFLPVGLLGLTFAAIFASQMATLSAQMVNSSALATRNLYKVLLRPHAGDREMLVMGRVIGIFLVAIGVFLATQLEKVADALAMLLGFASIMGVIVWGGVLWRRGNAAGAWAAVIVLFLAWSYYGPVGKLVTPVANRIPEWLADYPAAQSVANDALSGLGTYAKAEYVYELSIRYLPTGIVAFVVVSLLTPRGERKKVDDFFMLLKTPVGQEDKLIAAGVPIVYAGSTKANYWETNHPRLVHWGGFLLAALVCVALLGVLLLLARVGS